MKWQTFVGRWRAMPRWILQSRRSICVPVGRWFWFSLWMEPRRWFPFAFGPQFRGTLWCRQRGQCWRTSPYGYQCRISWWSCRKSHGCRQIPCPRRMAKSVIESMMKYINGINLEEGLWATEAFIAHGDDLTIRQLITLLKRRWRGGGGHFLLKVQSNVAKFFLKIFKLYSLFLF